MVVQEKYHRLAIRRALFGPTQLLARDVLEQRLGSVPCAVASQRPPHPRRRGRRVGQHHRGGRARGQPPHALDATAVNRQRRVLRIDCYSQRPPPRLAALAAAQVHIQAERRNRHQQKPGADVLHALRRERSELTDLRDHPFGLRKGGFGYGRCARDALAYLVSRRPNRRHLVALCYGHRQQVRCSPSLTARAASSALFGLAEARLPYHRLWRPFCRRGDIERQRRLLRRLGHPCLLLLPQPPVFLDRTVLRLPGKCAGHLAGALALHKQALHLPPQRGLDRPPTLVMRLGAGEHCAQALFFEKPPLQAQRLRRHLERLGQVLEDDRGICSELDHQRVANALLTRLPRPNPLARDHHRALLALAHHTAVPGDARSRKNPRRGIGLLPGRRNAGTRRGMEIAIPQTWRVFQAAPTSRSPSACRPRWRRPTC